LNYESAWIQLKEWVDSSSAELKKLGTRETNPGEIKRLEMRYIEFRNFARKIEEIENHS
jgi:hypothetical protein